MTDQPKHEEFRVPIKLFELGQSSPRKALLPPVRGNTWRIVWRCIFAATGAVMTTKTARRILTR